MTFKEIRATGITKDNIKQAAAKIYPINNFCAAVFRFIVNNSKTKDSDIQWACMHTILSDGRNHDLVVKCCNALRALNKDEVIAVFKYIQSNCKYREDVLS